MLNCLSAGDHCHLYPASGRTVSSSRPPLSPLKLSQWMRDVKLKFLERDYGRVRIFREGGMIDLLRGFSFRVAQLLNMQSNVSPKQQSPTKEAGSCCF